jgi:membrane fusion protein (multidrug efflux system)
LITASDNLLTTIVQTNPIYVNFSVSEADLLRMTKQVGNGQLKVPGSRASNGSLGFVVNVKLADGSKFPRSGKLNYASERVNPQTGSFDVRAEIPNPDGSLRPGQFVRVLLDGASRTNALSVPQRAVIDSPFGKMVFVIGKDDKLEPHPVELDGWSNGQWIVTKGVKSGDRVLVEGFIKAHDPGMVVKPVPYVPVAPGANGSAAGGSAPPAPASGAAPAASSPAAATSAASK